MRGTFNKFQRWRYRVQEISEILLKALRQLLKNFLMPVVALSQLSRAVEQRDDKKPPIVIFIS